MPFGETNRRRALVAGGERLQLPVYALAARLLGAAQSPPSTSSSGWRGRVKLTAVRFDEAATNAAIEALREVLRLADEAVAAGLYLPNTVSRRAAAPCRTCDFAAVCGPGHVRVYAAEVGGRRRERHDP